MSTNKSSRGSTSRPKGQPSTQRPSTKTSNVQSSTTGPLFISPISNAIFHLSQVVVLVALTALASLASQLALHPLYGSTVSSLNMRSIFIATCAASAARPSAPAHRILLHLSLLLAAAPFSARTLGSLAGRTDSSTWGPIVTQFGVVIPIVGLSTSLLRIPLESLHRRNVPTFANHVLASLIMAVGVQVVEPVLWKYIPFGGAFTSCNFFISLALTAGTISALCTPVKGSSPQQANRSLLTSALFISIPFIVALYSKSQAPCRTPPLPTTYYGTYRPPMANTSNLMMTGYRLGLLSPPTTLSNGTEPAVRNSTVNLLARTDSVTGTIVVAEFVEEGIRYLRADHSLLGGRWIGERAYGEYLGDSIYGTFTQQEAVRMVKRESIRDGENALVIGLGVGIAAEALIKHGNKVHIVEIDPAVYTYARGFFNLSEPYAVHLTDARQWVHEQYTTLQSMPAVLFPDMATNEDSKRTHSSDTEANRFGMVIHDCFSGGGVPSHLFSLEFWEDLKGIMTPDGVVAVNFAGHIGTPAARAIWFTLEKAFGTENRGRGCRVFHDRLEQPGEEHTTQEDEFMNMIYFCQKDEGIPSAQSSEKKKVEFRRANDRDYLKSWLRYAMLSSMLDREVTMERITGLTPENEGNVDGSEWILTDKNNRLAEWQHHSAIEHWGVMREVMPYSVWEVY